jgi:hypothetical protein
MAWKGWGIANDKVIDPSIGRPYSYWATAKGKKMKASIKNDKKKRDAVSKERRSKSIWN